MISPVSKGSGFSPKQSPQSLFTVFYNVLLKFSSTSSSPSCNRWLGRPHDCSLSLAVGGSSKSNMPSSLSTRTFNTSATNRQSLAFDSSCSFLSHDSTNFVGNPSDPATISLTSKSRPPTRPPIEYLYRLSPRVHQSVVHGPVSVHSARSRSAILPYARYIS